jgi:hypothetical protein
MILLESYRTFWKKAKEKTSCFPGDLSFPTLKAGEQNDINTDFECIMTQALFWLCPTKMETMH